MIDHLELQSRNVEASVDFYARVLAPLGYGQKVNGPAKGFGDDTGLDFFLVEGTPSIHVHFAFKAPCRRLVDQVYEIARQAGFKLDRAPALAPHIHSNYYAGYLRDPDGRLVEFVCHGAI
jgi:catechol 2,3-dioxygenase-like lactoylglutathione lyase family enzyme